MTQVHRVLGELARQGVVLRVRAERLIAAPKQALTPALRLAIAGVHPELVAHLRNEDSSAEPAAVAGRIVAMRAQLVHARGAIPFLVARPDVPYARGHCASCGDRAGTEIVRCRVCVLAVHAVLAELKVRAEPSTEKVERCS